MTRAKESFSRGQDLFDAGDFTGARDAFEESLEAFPHFRTVFNIALCEEKLGNVREAVDMYHRYLDWPSEVPEREAVEEKIAELSALLPPEEPEPVEPEAPPEEPDPSVGDRPPEDGPAPAPDDGADLAVPGWVLTAAGGAAVVAGVALLGAAKGAADDIEAEQGVPYDPEKHDAMVEDGETYEAAGWIVGGIGLAALVAGVAMLASGGGGEPEDAEPPVAAAAFASDRGAAAAISWRF